MSVPEPCHEQHHWHKWPRLVHTLHLDPHRNFHRECQENYFSFIEQLSKLCFIFPPLISGFLDPHTTFWGPCFQVPPNILNSAQFLIIPHPVTKSHLKLHDPIQHLGPHTTFRSSIQHYVIPCHVSGPSPTFHDPIPCFRAWVVWDREMLGWTPKCCMKRGMGLWNGGLGPETWYGIT